MALTTPSGGTLAQQRDIVEEFLDRTYNIDNPGTTSNGAGGYMASFTAGPRGILGRMRPKRRDADEVNQAGTMTNEQKVEILFPIGTGVGVRSRLTDVTDSGNPICYEVLGHDIGRSSAIDISVDAIRVDDGI